MSNNGRVKRFQSGSSTAGRRSGIKREIKRWRECAADTNPSKETDR